MAMTTGQTPAHGFSRVHGKEVALYVMLSGILGGLFLTVTMAAARATGVFAVNLERSFGSLLLGTTGPGAFLVGLIMHLAFSAIFALIYAEGFRRLHAANWKIGAGLGIVHWAAMGLFIGIMPTLRPMLAASLAEPGPFAMNQGVFSFLFLLAVHLVFGALVGLAYQRTAEDHPELLAPRG